jgi:hypothetical protein
MIILIIIFRLAGEEGGWRNGAPLSDPGPGLAQRLPPGSVVEPELFALRNRNLSESKNKNKNKNIYLSFSCHTYIIKMRFSKHSLHLFATLVWN